MSPRMGKLKEIDKLDSTFFGIVPKVADEVDPQARILLETTYEAICDAGSYELFALLLFFYQSINFEVLV